MTIAVPVWNGNVSPVLDTAGTLKVFTVENGCIIDRHDYSIAKATPQEKARIIAGNAGTIICGAVSSGLAMMLEEAGLTVYSWVMGNAERLVEVCAAGGEPGPESLMPGCRGSGTGRGRGRNRCGRPQNCGNRRER